VGVVVLSASPGSSGHHTEPPVSRHVRKLYALVAILSALVVGLVAGIFAYAAGGKTPYEAVGIGAAVTASTLAMAFLVMGFVTAP
jgi:hypothetical protein